MKHTLIKSALMAVAGLALCAPLAIHAQTATSTTTTASTMSTTSTKMKKTEYRGMVKSIDTAANTITVTNKKGDMTLSVASTTKITQNKQPATLADITMGEKVTGSFTKDATGTMTACKINGHSAPAAATTSSTSTSTTTTSTNAAPTAP
jgi:hypothetical protein